MIIKSQKEADTLREGGKILAMALNKAAIAVKAGISAYELDQIAEQEVRRLGAVPSFLNYQTAGAPSPFPGSLCVSINDEVVHGIPSKEKILKEGDIVGLDLGVKFQGLYTDAAITVPVGKIQPQLIRLLKTAKECLGNALQNVKPGNFIGDISFAIQQTAEKNGFSVVRELVGHGVGRAVHEDPEIPCFGQPKTGKKILFGMVLAIEPMVNIGGWKIKFEGPWSVHTADESHSAHFEHTVLVTDQGCEVLTNVV